MSKPKAMESYDTLEVEEYGVSLNGKQAPYELQDIGSLISLQDFIALPCQCPFCNANLINCGNFDLSDNRTYYHKQYYLWYCRNCRFWQWFYYHESNLEATKVLVAEGCPGLPNQHACISKLREFNNHLPDSCSSELAQYLRSKPSAWHHYQPKLFEKLVADIFRANYDGAEVIHVGKPDDGGVDIILIDSNKEQWLIQVKRRERAECAEGVRTIRDLIGAMMLEGALRGIVVSTADHFTPRAQQAAKAKRLTDKGMHIELIDRGILDRMLDPVLPDRPWLRVVDMYDPEIAELLALQISSDYQFRLFDS